MALILSHGDQDHLLNYLRQHDRLTLTHGGATLDVEILHYAAPRLTLRRTDGDIIDAVVWRTSGGYAVQIGTARSTWDIVRTQRSGTGDGAAGGAQRVVAPLPGRIIAVHVNVGDNVAAQQPLLIIEAMKMQNEIAAARSGTVQAIHVKPGDAVDGGSVLLEIS